MQHISSSVQCKLERLRYVYRHGGAGGVLFYLCYRLVNCVTRLRIFRMAILEASAPIESQLGHLDAYRHELLSPAELAEFADDPENDLTHEFLDHAAAQGDTCYAIFEDGVLVSYCWNSDRPTTIEQNLDIEFRSGYVYRYKEYTRRSHRGRRLSLYGRAESLRRFAAAGVLGYAGYVEANNYVSYRALQRGGHCFPGFIVVLGKGPQPWIWHSPQARAWGFRVVAVAAPLIAPQARPVP